MEDAIDTSQKNGWKNHEEVPEEKYRKAMIGLTSEITLLKEEIAMLEKSRYQLMNRIRELTDAPCCGEGPRAQKIKEMKENNDIPDLQ